MMSAARCRSILELAAPMACAIVLASPALSQEAPPPAEPGFLRVVERPGESLALEVAARRFTRADGGPEVTLVGVAHIGDAALYQSLQHMLDQFDIVLYESVKPAGAGRPGGSNDAERIASTQEALRFIAGLVELHSERFQSLPASLEALSQKVASLDPRVAQWSKEASIDAWGHAVVYRAPVDSESYALSSLGADGAPGGEGPNADISLGGEAVEPHALSTDDGLQATLADALGLEFQLEAIDYGRPNWRCSDMTMDQLSREMAERGIDFAEFGGTLAGTSFPAALVNGLLKVIRLLDVLSNGMMSDMAKIMMIEVLGNESITEMALGSQFGEGFGEVIVDERNQIVMDDLKRLIESEPEVGTVGIFYGAAHMGDFVQRLRDQLGYSPQSVEWVPAMTVNLRDSALTEADLKQMRQMIRRSLQGMKH